jgi:hypothetical protein
MSLLLAWPGPADSISAGEPSTSESGSLIWRPANSATLASALAGFRNGRELEIRMMDAAPTSVEFVGYDTDRDVLMYRDRVPFAREETRGGFDYEQIDEVRLVERHKSAGDILLGLVGGVIIGGTVGYMISQSTHPEDFYGGMTGGQVGAFFGGITGVVVGAALPGRKVSETVLWQREEER